MKEVISMHENYKKHGVKDYYIKNSENYINLHGCQIRDLLIKNINRFNFGSVLDLCCGSGEVTRVLLENGIKDVEGADPYTFKLYIKNTGKHCINLSFKDILRGKLNKNYNIIICSFAFHLINEKDLFMIVNKLFLHTKTIIIIAPHKRPYLERIKGVNLKFSDYSLTPKGKRVYLRAYEYSTYRK